MPSSSMGPREAANWLWPRHWPTACSAPSPLPKANPAEHVKDAQLVEVNAFGNLNPQLRSRSFSHKAESLLVTYGKIILCPKFSNHMAIVWLLYAQRYGIYAYSGNFSTFFVKSLRKTQDFQPKPCHSEAKMNSQTTRQSCVSVCPSKNSRGLFRQFDIKPFNSSIISPSSE